jgi:polyisoprenoid-binding protein YceI
MTIVVTSTALALALLAAEPRTLSLDPAASVVRYHVNHKMHAVDGRSTAIEGKALIGGDGTVRTMVRVPVAGFDSGDANRDSNMRETLDAGQHPYVVFKGVASVPVPVTSGKPLPTTLRGELDFHGVKKPIEVPVTVEFAADGSAAVRGKMTISLDAYDVERPSLLFVKMDDACTIDLDLKLEGSGS